MTLVTRAEGFWMYVCKQQLIIIIFFQNKLIQFFIVAEFHAIRISLKGLLSIARKGYQLSVLL